MPTNSCPSVVLTPAWNLCLRDTPAGLQLTSTALSEVDGVSLGAGTRRALAALTLYGQDYGFHPEDAAGLRDVARAVRGSGLNGPGNFSDQDDFWAYRLEGLAARIDMLLPEAV